ncbi:MAG: hypothetical protein ACM37W_12630 [Actinomycetota bacterium]
MANDTFSFTVTNNTELAISEIWASPDDDEWFQFEIPEEGIAPGETATIYWADWTDDYACEWYISTVFEDESESESVLFNFCENPDLVVND